MDVNEMSDVPKIDAEARGRRRIYKAALAKAYRRFDRVFNGKALVDDIVAMAARKNAVGRGRAFARIAAALAPTGAVLEGVRLEGKHPLAVWSILKPRCPVTVEPEDPADDQDCITVDYALIGMLDIGPMRGDGLWSLEVTDHALGRLIQRAPKVDPSAVLMEAHHSLLALPSGSDFRRPVLLHAGPGGFVVEGRAGMDVSRGGITLHVTARTWIDRDMVPTRDVVLIEGVGAPGHRLGDNVLLPAPLCQLVEGDSPGELKARVWAPGLPQTMAAPAGRA